MSTTPRVERDGTITRDGEVLGRILSWQPPRLVIERDGSIEQVFVIAGESDTFISRGGKTWPLPKKGAPAASAGGVATEASGELTAPMPGKVLEVQVEAGQTVAAGDRLLVLEAMKMEMPVRAPFAGTVRTVHVTAGAGVDPGQPLVDVDPEEEA